MNTSIRSYLVPAALLTTVAFATAATLGHQAAQSRREALGSQVAQLKAERAQKLATLKASPVARPIVPTPSLPECLGMVRLRGSGGGFLQSYTNGTIHASNERQNEEETWFLYLVDAQKHEYALRNWRTGMFLSRQGGTGYVFANAIGIGATERWVLEDGKRYGPRGVWALRAAQSGAYLGANAPGEDVKRKPWENVPSLGEVAAMDPQKPWTTAHWSGYWTLEAVHTPPTPGRDFWNTTASVLEVAGKAIWAKLSGADVAKLLGA